MVYENRFLLECEVKCKRRVAGFHVIHLNLQTESSDILQHTHTHISTELWGLGTLGQFNT